MDYDCSTIQFTFFLNRLLNWLRHAAALFFQKPFVFTWLGYQGLLKRGRKTPHFPLWKASVFTFFLQTLESMTRCPFQTQVSGKSWSSGFVTSQKKTKPNIGQMAAVAQAYTYYCRCYPFYKAIFKAGATTGRRQ